MLEIQTLDLFGILGSTNLVNSVTGPIDSLPLPGATDEVTRTTNGFPSSNLIL